MSRASGIASTRYQPARTSDGRGVYVFVEDSKVAGVPAAIKARLDVQPGEARHQFVAQVGGKSGRASKAWLTWTLDDIRDLVHAEDAGQVQLVTHEQFETEGDERASK